jgi:hypothetical protein
MFGGGGRFSTSTIDGSRRERMAHACDMDVSYNFLGCFFSIVWMTWLRLPHVKLTELITCNSALCCLLHAQCLGAQVKMEMEHPWDQSGAAPIWEQSLYKQWMCLRHYKVQGIIKWKGDKGLSLHCHATICVWVPHVCTCSSGSNSPNILEKGNLENCLTILRSPPECTWRQHAAP